MRARGLKPPRCFASASRPTSRPVRARGLKPSHLEQWAKYPPSRPVRARGLKHHLPRPQRHQVLVAPRAGAWLETACRCVFSASIAVAPRAGAWLETAPEAYPP